MKGSEGMSEKEKISKILKSIDYKDFAYRILKILGIVLSWEIGKALGRFLN